MNAVLEVFAGVFIDLPKEYFYQFLRILFSPRKFSNDILNNTVTLRSGGRFLGRSVAFSLFIWNILALAFDIATPSPRVVVVSLLFEFILAALFFVSLWLVGIVDSRHDTGMVAFIYISGALSQLWFIVCEAIYAGNIVGAIFLPCDKCSPRTQECLAYYYGILSYSTITHIVDFIIICGYCLHSATFA